MDRRTVLATGAVAATAGLASGALAQSNRSAGSMGADAQSAPTQRRIVTLEEHFMVPALVEKMHGVEKRHLGNPRLKAALGDLEEERLKFMDQYGITMQVISATMPGADLLDGDNGIQFARETNDHLAAAIRRHPDRFAGFAHLPMRSPEVAADELDRTVTELGFRGALINGTTQDRFLDHPSFAPVLARAARLGVPIYIHPNWPPQKVIDAYYSDLPGMTGFALSGGGFGWHIEVAIHVLRLAVAGTFEKHRGLNIIIGHMGESLPSMLDRADDAIMGMARTDVPVSKVILDRVYLTTAGVWSTPAFLSALTKFGADRILFSVDYPYAHPDRGVPWLDTIPVSPADKVKIMSGNADRLLKLGAA